ncbi:MAG: ABC transporter permease [Microbacteriaceae bacterium]
MKNNSALKQVATVAIALVVGAIVILIVGFNPLEVYAELLAGAGYSVFIAWIPGIDVNVPLALGNLFSTINQWAPLILLGLSSALPFRAGLFNIGSQGQYLLGMVLGVQVALILGNSMGIVLGIVFAAVGGAIAGLVAGALKAFRNANEVVTTIMINWLVVYAGRYLYGTGGPLADQASGRPMSPPFPDQIYLPILAKSGIELNMGIIIAVVAVAIYWFLVTKTSFGFSVDVAGKNPDAAHYAGMPVRRIIVMVFAIGGAFAGIAGVIQTLGVTHQVSASGIVASSSFAFSGIAIALLGRNSTLGVVLAALLFATLESGARFLSGGFPLELARSFSGVLQGVIVLLVGAEHLLDKRGVQLRKIFGKRSTARTEES